MAAKQIGTKELSVSKIIQDMKLLLKSNKIDTEYIVITNREFKSIKKVELKNSIILIAVKIGKTRLIDNIWI